MIAPILAALGLKLAPIAGAAGMIAAAAIVALPAYGFGRWQGDRAGFARADKQAELNDARRKLAERELDLAATRRAEADARATAETNAQAAAAAQENADAFARELATRGPAGACLVDERDAVRLRELGRPGRDAVPPLPPARGRDRP